MENKRKALGRGLEQLFNNESIFVSPVNTIEEVKFDNDDKNEEIIMVEVKELRSNPYQPRQTFDQEKLVELANSIKEHGVIEPIIVTKSIKGYEIVAGERRKKACELAGIEKIPAILKEFTDEQMMEIALLENIQREDLTAIEEAEAYSNLIKALNITQNELAEKVGKSRVYITNSLGLLRLPESTKNDILHGFLSQGHAKVLSKLESEEEIIKLANKVKSEHLSVRALEELASNPELKKSNIVKRNKTNTYSYVEDALTETIGNRVKIKSNKIIIPFINDKDLERILDIIKVEIKVD
ncbi:MAG: ParB/RepB/Spo0J family partition protein [Bacilli bacterium]|nr:ParB/RepB/Spo0J family partition protein [Bacilli bacterium]MBQ4263604.1 ParB/RepB/Spo0J family partition protein [Bacilli bacterium]